MADHGWASELRAQPREAWPSFLAERSGLPGPRANLALVVAAAALADLDTIETLLTDGGEYATMCAAAALARRAEARVIEARAQRLATDERWRVREGVALGLQLLGNTKPDALSRVATAWADDERPLVQRAAVAAICEPRLLHDDAVAVAALDVCRRATDRYAALPASRRKADDARSLRQALGYCWSIAIVARPREGKEAFSTLDDTDRDVAWIISQNRRKKRLASLL